MLTFVVLPVAAQAADVTLNLKVFLQGPYSGMGQMKSACMSAANPAEKFTDLYVTIALPQYAQAVVIAQPKVLTQTVDLVEVQLLTPGGKLAASVLGFLQSNGSVVDANGNAITLKAEAGSYYVAVKHRSHLPLVSAQKVEVAPNGDQSLTFDFTNPANLTKNSALINEKGVALAVAGELYADRGQTYLEINAMDLGLAYAYQAAGSLLADVNLDGKTDAADMQIIAGNNDQLFATKLP